MGRQMKAPPAQQRLRHAVQICRQQLQPVILNALRRGRLARAAHVISHNEKILNQVRNHPLPNLLMIGVAMHQNQRGIALIAPRFRIQLLLICRADPLRARIHMAFLFPAIQTGLLA